jgi:hypothetical protein
LACCITVSAAALQEIDVVARIANFTYDLNFTDIRFVDITQLPSIEHNEVVTLDFAWHKKGR